MRIKSKIAENENLNDANNSLLEELEQVNENIAKICADKNKKLVDEYLGRGKNNDGIDEYEQ